MTELLQSRIHQLIKKNGFTVMGIFPTEDNPCIAFSYTVGLAIHGGYEYLIAGLPHTSSHGILTSLYHQLLNGWRASDGDISNDIANLPVKFVLMGDKHEANMSRNYWDGTEVKDFQVLQLVWCDTQGRFPTDEGFEERFVGIQNVEGSKIFL